MPPASLPGVCFVVLVPSVNPMTATPMVGSTFFGIDISQLATRLIAMRRRISKRVLLLEFRPDSLLLAEATLMQAGVKLSHISSFSLPPEALDRGVPAEPLKMAGLLNDFCAEKKIPAHRVAVVLPPELAFHRLLDLPANLKTDEAREYVLNPVNGLQIPFPLTQTDFDLYPISPPIEQQCPDESRLYMLTAIPQVLIDPIVEMLQAANLELQLLELGSHSQLRNHAAELITLAPQQVDLVLELLPDCSNLMLVSCSGLLGSERLAAIRNLPELDIEPDQVSVALETGLTAENVLLKDENYLPISDLDLRVLVADLRASVQRCHLKLPCAEIRRLILVGVNSSHPNLADLFAEILGIPVVFSQPSDVTGLVELSMDDLLLQSSLGRLSGLALGLLPNEQFLSCSLASNGSNNQDSYRQNDAIAIADLLNSSEAQTGLDLVAVEVHSDRVIDDEENDHEELSVTAGIDSLTEVAAVSDEISKIPIEITEAQGLISPLMVSTSLEEEPLLIISDEQNLDSSSDQQSASISSRDAHQIADEADLSEEKWPSIKAFADGMDNSTSSAAADDSLELSSPNIIIDQDETASNSDALLIDSEWPSIASRETISEDQESDLRDESDTSTWPSIVLHNQQDLINSEVVFEKSISSEKEEDAEELCSEPVAHVIISDPSVDSEPSSHEQFDALPPSEEYIASEGEELCIPDLNSSDEVVDIMENSKHDESIMDDSDSANVSSELGELRFAKED